MPICNECLQPCACMLSDLPTVGSTGLIEESEFGLLRVDGTGTLSDPFTISFPNSENYRPIVGELAFNPYSHPSGGSSAPTAGAVVIYQSPGIVFLVVPSPANPAIVQQTESVLFVGASVEFTANAVGERTLSIQQSGGVSVVEVARSHSDGTVEQSHRLSASGIAFHPLTAANLAPITSPKYTQFNIFIHQSSGSALTINTVKFWTVSL